MKSAGTTEIVEELLGIAKQPTEEGLPEELHSQVTNLLDLLDRFLIQNPSDKALLGPLSNASIFPVRLPLGRIALCSAKDRFYIADNHSRGRDKYTSFFKDCVPIFQLQGFKSIPILLESSVFPAGSFNYLHSHVKEISAIVGDSDREDSIRQRYTSKLEFISRFEFQIFLQGSIN